MSRMGAVEWWRSISAPSGSELLGRPAVAARAGYLLKDRVSDVEELADAVRRVASGGCVVDPEVVTRLLERRRRTSAIENLSHRERDVLELMAQGLSNHAIPSFSRAAWTGGSRR